MLVTNVTENINFVPFNFNDLNETLSNDLEKMVNARRINKKKLNAMGKKDRRIKYLYLVYLETEALIKETGDSMNLKESFNEAAMLLINNPNINSNHYFHMIQAFYAPGITLVGDIYSSLPDNKKNAISLLVNDKKSVFTSENDSEKSVYMLSNESENNYFPVLVSRVLEKTYDNISLAAIKSMNMLFERFSSLSDKDLGLEKENIKKLEMEALWI